MQVLRFFNDELSGDECAIVLKHGEEICVSADEAYDALAEERVLEQAYELSVSMLN